MGAAVAAAARTRPLLGSAIREDSSTASKSEEEMVLSSSINAGGQDASADPWKYQLLPLSATIRP